jgi:hypothetical protein
MIEAGRQWWCFPREEWWKVCSREKIIDVGGEEGLGWRPLKNKSNISMQNIVLV